MWLESATAALCHWWANCLIKTGNSTWLFPFLLPLVHPSPAPPFFLSSSSYKPLIFPENTAWIRTGQVNDSLISFHWLNSDHFGDPEAKEGGEEWEGRSGGGCGAEGGAGGRGFWPAGGSDARWFCTLVPWLAYRVLEGHGTPQCPPGDLELGALSRSARSRNGVRVG